MKIVRATKNGTIDRRVARTLALLQDALIALIPKRGYAAITVEHICREANVGRSTFYAHYVGKDQLRSATINAHLQSLAREHGHTGSEPSGRLFEFSLPMFEHARAYHALHRALLGSMDNAIHDELRERIRRSVRREIADKRIGDASLPIELAVQFVAGAFLAVLAWWIARDTALSPARLDGMFQKMVAKGIGASGTEAL